SLGNYIFDQKYQHTMMSYMVDTRVDYTGVHQMSVVPFYLEQFVPKFLKGDAGIRTIQRVMRLSEFLGTTIVPDETNCRGIVAMGPASFSTTPASEPLSMPTTYTSAVGGYVSDAWEIPPGSHLSAVTAISGTSGTRHLMLGQDMLMFGTFEDEDIDGDTMESPGWEIPDTNSARIYDYNPYEGDLCLRLRRHYSDYSEVNVSSYRRIPLQYQKKYLVCGYMRTHDSGNAWVTVTCHYWPYTWDDWRDTETTVYGPISGDNDWHYFEGWFTGPYDLLYATVQMHLEPDSGSADYGYAYFDNVRVVEFDETLNPLLPIIFPNPGGERYVALRTSSYSPSASVTVSLN
ncbi:MAG TPA: hypothetical protein PLV45_19505, partial [bacterium]|nr:hypothetical protein [bacterium]